MPLGSGSDSPEYPEGMPADMKQLRACWEYKDKTVSSSFQRCEGGGGLVVFSHYEGDWKDFEKWNRSFPQYEIDEAVRVGTDEDAVSWGIFGALCSFFDD